MTATPPSVFLSYSHKDAVWMRRLADQLRLYELEKLLTVWEDRQIRAGQDWLPAIESTIGQVAGLDWFTEQAEDPELIRLRGLRRGEPLPAVFGLFDETGRPLPVQRRESWLALQAWLENDEEILSFAFPEGLKAEDREVLLADLKILRRQPWSPMRGVAVLLDNWPATQEEKVITLEEAERKVVEACERALAELEKPKKGQKGKRKR